MNLTIKQIAPIVESLPVADQSYTEYWANHFIKCVEKIEKAVMHTDFEAVTLEKLSPSAVRMNFTTGFGVNGLPVYCQHLMRHLAASVGCALVESDGALDLKDGDSNKATFKLAGKEDAIATACIMYVHIYRLIQKAGKSRNQFISELGIPATIEEAYAHVEGVQPKSIAARQKKVAKLVGA